MTTFTPRAEIIYGDCIAVMRGMAAESVDAICTDPPYGLEFMGKDWDAPWREAGARFRLGESKAGCSDVGGRIRDRAPEKYVAGPAFQAWCLQWATEALRVLKPGGHLVAFGGTRTFHRLTCAVEDTGFEVRDCLMWMYGTGFPKSLDVSKAIDKSAGAEREVVGEGVYRDIRNGHGREYGEGIPAAARGGPEYITVQKTAPATEAAREWQGWGTGLKPAWEPIILARKPMSERNVALNVQRWGTGALNIDGCLIGDTVETWPATRSYAPGQRQPGGSGSTQGTGAAPAGRWPANVVLNEEAARALDEQSGERPAGAPRVNRRGVTTGSSIGGHGRYNTAAPQDAITGYGDTGGASRFFYCAKASQSERGEGNDHPTVKPTDLMRWLVRLVTTPGGTILDPFAGSGTTLVAAAMEGFNSIGIEQDAGYVEIAKRRVYAASQPRLALDASAGGAL